MKAWILAGVITVVTAPAAFAGEDLTECQLDEQRREATQRTEDVDAIDTAEVANVARPTVAQREVVVPAPAPRPGGTDRRRNGKPIPDAQLIGPRGAL
jgi:hypothetical protein